MRRILKKVLAIGLTFSLTGCGHYFEGNNIIDNETGSLTGESQSTVQEMEVIAIDDSIPQVYYKASGITAATDGYYVVSHGGGYYIGYYDIKTGILGCWCSRADCKHTDISICTAIYGENIYKRWLQVHEGYIYQLKFTDDGAYLMRRNLDGSNFVQISKLWDTNALGGDVEEDRYNGKLLLQGGYLYYIVTEDSENMTLLRSSVDGSVSREVVYKWKKSIIADGYGIKGDSKNVYIYGLYFRDDDGGFIVRYNSENGELEEIYRKSSNGEISGYLSNDVESISVYQGGLYYYSQTAGTNYYYNLNNKTEKEFPYKADRKLFVSPDGAHLAIDYRTSLLILDSEGKELMTIDYKEKFPHIEGDFMLDGIDERNIVLYVSGSVESSGEYIIDRRSIETGNIELKKIGIR